MKKTLLSVGFSIFVLFGFTGQSWAFGWLGGHHHDGSNGGNQGDNFSGNGGFDPSGNFDFDQNFETNGDGGSFPTNSWDNSSDNSWDNSWDNSSDNSWSDGDKHHHHHDDGGNSWGNSDWSQNSLGGANDPGGDPVPEPMTLPLLGMGLLGVLLIRKMRAKA